MATKDALFQNQAEWVAGLSTEPVFIDGLTSQMSYLIAACKAGANQYEAVVIRKMDSDSFKVKFYGSFEDWGFNESSLADKFRAGYFKDRSGRGQAGYQRYFTDREGVALILQALQTTRNVVVCPPVGVMQAFQLKHEKRLAISQNLHPARGGLRPQLPFTPPVLLNEK